MPGCCSFFRRFRTHLPHGDGDPSVPAESPGAQQGTRRDPGANRPPEPLQRVTEHDQSDREHQGARSYHLRSKKPQVAGALKQSVGDEGRAGRDRLRHHRQEQSGERHLRHPVEPDEPSDPAPAERQKRAEHDA